MSEIRLPIGVEPAKAMAAHQVAVTEYFRLALRANGVPTATLLAIDTDRGEVIASIPDPPSDPPSDA